LRTRFSVRARKRKEKKKVEREKVIPLAYLPNEGKEGEPPITRDFSKKALAVWGGEGERGKGATSSRMLTKRSKGSEKGGHARWRDREGDRP